MPRRDGWWVVVAGLILVAGAAPAAAAVHAPTLRTVDLATWGRGGYIYDVNRSGQVLGALNDAQANAQPVLWRRYDTAITLGIDRGSPQALNDLGHVVGVGGGSEPSASWLWTGHAVTYLRAPGRVWAADVNNHDQVVGYVEGPGTEPVDAFLWRGGQFIYLGAPAGMSSYAVKVNNRGVVLGYLVNQDWSVMQGFVWQNGVMAVLRGPGGGFVQPIDINDRGQVIVATSVAGSDITHPFLWQRGQLVDLMAGRPDEDGWPSDINDRGDIVGSAGPRAVLWHDGRAIDLGVSGSASRLNERGDIAGTSYAVTPTGEVKLAAFRWSNGRLLFSAPIIGPEVSIGVTGIDGRGRVVGRISDGYSSDRVVAWVVH